ncbi:hypothetical protein M407DRAFT_177452 [Tulasnella calospora MUT 4182]|uniref:Uncharacterized protein n=1 Tax=Tulasnella calospora MUT 4182 TaxID=1051891 RepID=A0A0C3MJ81_9AGAM|nr:hypothetical protein M407DRAFT_177452 [Tulasnella calospora MUT 4182]
MFDGSGGNHAEAGYKTGPPGDDAKNIASPFVSPPSPERVPSPSFLPPPSAILVSIREYVDDGSNDGLVPQKFHETDALSTI